MIRHPITRGRLNKMMKYFRNKRVLARYEFNNSNGGHWVTEDKFTYDSFIILGEYDQFTLVFLKDGDIVFEQGADIYGHFTGVGTFVLNYSGPDCFFKIRRCA